MFTFKQLQDENKEWVKRNFHVPRPDPDGYWKPILGVMEELGELSHAILKRSQGIRGSYDEHTLAAKDAIGDITVYLADVCSALGFDFNQIVKDTWEQVKQRDWNKNKDTGVVEPPTPVDMLGRLCVSCLEGEYKETSAMDDITGVVHCSICGHTVLRWSTVAEIVDKNTPELSEQSSQLIQAGAENWLCGSDPKPSEPDIWPSGTVHEFLDSVGRVHETDCTKSHVHQPDKCCSNKCWCVAQG